MTTIRLVCIVLGGFTSSCLKSIIFLLQYSFSYYYSALAAHGNTLWQFIAAPPYSLCLGCFDQFVPELRVGNGDNFFSPNPGAVSF